MKSLFILMLILFSTFLRAEVPYEMIDLSKVDTASLSHKCRIAQQDDPDISGARKGAYVRSIYMHLTKGAVPVHTFRLLHFNGKPTLDECENMVDTWVRDVYLAPVIKRFKDAWTKRSLTFKKPTECTCYKNGLMIHPWPDDNMFVDPITGEPPLTLKDVRQPKPCVGTVIMEEDQS